MTKASQNINDNTEEDWTIAGPLPDRIYFMKLLRRHFAFLAVGSMLALFGAVFIALNVENVYESRVSAVFDQTDISGSGMGVRNQPSYNVVSRLFQARFNSQDFLYELALEVGIDKDLKEAKFPFNLISSSDEPAEAVDEADKIKEKLQIVKYMKKNIRATPEQYTGILNLTATSNDPDKASKLAQRAIEKFIAEELKYQVEAVDRKLKLLRQGVQDVTNPEDQEKLKNTKDMPQPSPLKKLEIAEQETRLETDLRRITNELNRNRTDQKNIKNTYNTEIQRLLANLQPNHPRVRTKENELDSKLKALRNTEANLNKEAEKIRSKLWRTRVSKVQTEGAMIPGGEGLSYQGAFFIAVSDRIKDLSLERINLIKQIDDPDQRTRIKILFPASIDKIPVKSVKRRTAVMIAILGGAFVLLFVLYKEFTNPLARDDWRIERRTDHPILTQIANRSISKFPMITPVDSDKLREGLRYYSKNDLGSRTILSYRRLELAVNQNCRGKVILLSSSGPFDKLGKVINNFINIFSTDMDVSCVVVDFDNSDPLIPKTQYEKQISHDLLDVMDEEANLDQTMIKSDDVQMAYDLVPPFKNYQGAKTRKFNGKKIGPIISALDGKYDYIFLRSFPEYFFTENIVLSEIASDCVVFVDAKKTCFPDLDRTLTHMDSDKLRGLVLVGT